MFNEKKSHYILAFLIAISLIIRLYNVDTPLFSKYSMREVHTAITVQNWLNEGINVFKYKTPIFGENSVIPFEFPFYQFTVYCFYKIFSLIYLDSLDLMCHITNILYFYLSAIFLYKIANYIFKNKNLSVTIVAVYLLSPFTIYWSRTGLMDYCSVFFGLGYAYFFIKWIIEPSKFYYLVILFGICAYLSKITTVITIIPLVAYYTIDSFLHGKGIFERTDRKLFRKNCIKWSIVVVTPLFFGLAWVYWTDLMKTLSHAEAITSRNLRSFNFGTFKQKINFENWKVIINRIKIYFMPELCVGLLLFIPFTSTKDLRKIFLFIITIIFTIFTFFNLYFLHDYYLIALSPMISIILGYSLYNFATYSIVKKRKIFMAIMLILFIFSLKSQTDYWAGINLKKEEYPQHFDILPLGDYIKNNTVKTDKITIFDNSWNADILYYSDRIGCMIGSDIIKPEFMKQEIRNCKLVVCQHTDSIVTSNLFEGLIYLNTIGRWKIYQPVSWSELVETQTQNQNQTDLNDVFNFQEIFQEYPIEVKAFQTLRKVEYKGEKAILFHPDGYLKFKKSNNNVRKVSVNINLLPDAYEKGNSDGVIFYWERQRGSTWEILNSYFLSPEQLRKNKDDITFSANIKSLQIGDLYRLRVDGGPNQDNSSDWAIINHFEKE